MEANERGQLRYYRARFALSGASPLLQLMAANGGSKTFIEGLPSTEIIDKE